MPVMPRMNKKAKKIAYLILGKPANLRFKPNKKQIAIDKRLQWEDTWRAR